VATIRSEAKELPPDAIHPGGVLADVAKIQSAGSLIARIRNHRNQIPQDSELTDAHDGSSREMLSNCDATSAPATVHPPQSS
jgi:hypothetical protein